ncbi:MAG: hypothetical protein AW11_04070 [Candidatus Accumulibacter regalis]|uniref:Uncharacterized protein n=1 Tax=Accumulibacter regalis TaxID=522306 RepID=A0A011P893_ACCRE|nr:MAG: hypothetical protein AW11_04070 [Candidatus Accumulibacter regalis]
MQRAKAELDLRMQRVLHVDHRQTVGILRFELSGLDRGHDLLEGVDRNVRVELAGNGDQLAVRSDVNAVRRFRLRNQEDNAFLDRNIQRQDIVAVDLLGLSGSHQLGGFLPVDHVHVVGVFGRATRFIGRATLFDTANVTLGTEGVGERPAVGRPLAGIRQVLAVRRQLDRERLRRIDAPFLAIELPVGDAAAVFLVELFERLELLVRQRRRILRSLDHVLGVGRDEGAAMLGLVDRVDDDLLGFEIAQVDHRQAWVGLVVDEQELAIVLTLGLRHRRVVRVTPGNVLAVDLALGKDRLRAFVKAIALPGFRREHTDVLEDAHRRHTIDDDLSRLATGRESDELVALSGRHIGLGGGEQVLL